MFQELYEIYQIFYIALSATLSFPSIKSSELDRTWHLLALFVTEKNTRDQETKSILNIPMQLLIGKRTVTLHVQLIPRPEKKTK